MKSLKPLEVSKLLFAAQSIRHIQSEDTSFKLFSCFRFLNAFKVINLKRVFTLSLVLSGCSVFAQWNTNSFPFTYTSYSVQAAENTLVVSAFNEIHKSRNGGEDWTVTPVQFTNYDSTKPWLFYITRVMYVSENVAFSFNNVAGIVTIFKSVDGGSNWTLVHYSGGNIQNMQWVSPSIGYAVGSAGKILKTTNGGNTWEDLSSPTESNLQSLHFLDANNGIIIGSQIILKTTNGGSSWVSIVTEESFNSVFLISSKRGYVKGSKGIEPFVFDATGSLHFNFDYNHIATSELYYTDPLTGYYLSSDGLFKTVDGGKFWSQQKNTKGYNASEFDFFGKDIGLFTGYQIDFPYTKKIFTTVTGGDPMPQNDPRLLDINEYPSDLCRGEYPVKARVINEGINDLTSTIFRWSVNGIEQTPSQWTGMLSPGDTAEVIVGNYNFNRTARDFNVVVWTDQPNNTNDDNITNDSKSITYRFNKFNGTYFIGGSNNDFDKISDAIQEMNTYGVCGDIVFSFRSGTYENDPIYIRDPIYPLNDDLKLVFQSETNNPNDVTISYSNGSHIDIGYISHVSFRNLKIVTNGNIYLTADSVLVENCILKNTSTFGSISAVSMGDNTKKVLFRDNTVEGGYAGVYTYSGNPNFSTGEWIFEGNTFLNQRQGGIYFETGLNRKVWISQNKFFSTNQESYLGIFLENDAETFVVNNYIHAFSAIAQSTVIGMSIQNGNARIYNNTVVLNSDANAIAILISRTNPAIIKNNNLVNLSKGSIYALIEDKNTVIDYNNVYSPYGTILQKYNDELHLTNLAAWQATSGFDMHSISIDPQIVGSDDVHVQLSTSNYGLNGTGTPLNEVLTDIDGDLRDIQNPDIGVDEFTIPLVDLGLTELSSGEQICSGNVSFKVRVNNYGKSSVDSFTINWTADGNSQTPITMGPLSHGSYFDVDLGSLTLSAGSHQIGIIIEALSDGVARNNSLTMSVKVGGMSGTFSIGGNSPHYATISSAIEAIKTNGVCGNVYFNIRPGTYNENLILPVFPGISENARIIFQSELKDSTSVNIKSTEDIVFQGTKWVILQHVRISTGIKLMGGASHNTFRSNIIEGNIKDDLYNAEEYNRLLNNCINHPSEGAAILLSGYSFVGFERGNVINGNTLKVSEGGAVTRIDINFQDGVEVKNNNLQNNLGGISLKNCINEYQVSGNFINGGIGLYRNLNKTQLRGTIANNITYGKYGGIDIDISDNINISNNTIIQNGDLYQSHALGVNENTDEIVNFEFDNIEIKNNIIISLSDAVCIAYNPKHKIVSDYNVFYALTNRTMAYSSGNGRWGIGGITEYFDGLNLWQQRSKQDAHSFFFMPGFVSSSDFHIGNDPRLKGKGASVGLSIDVDGDQRNAATPDIGADEFTLTLFNNDAGVSAAVRPDNCGNEFTAHAKLKNFGKNKITSVTINWSVNGDLQTPFAWTGSLDSGEEINSLAIGNYFLNASDTTEIKIWTTLPNGAIDTNNLNDTIVVDRIYQRLNGFYTIGQSTGSPTAEVGDFPNIGVATAYLNAIGVCGPVTFNIQPGTYNEVIILREIEGASRTNRITFQSATNDSTSVVLNGTDPDPMYNEKGQLAVLLDGADYITIKNLTMYSSVGVKFVDGASHNEILHNRIIAGGHGYDSYSMSLIDFSHGHNTYNLIEGNYLSDNWFGVGLSNSNFPTSSTDHTIIRKNIFNNQYLKSIGLIYPNSNTIIEQNRFDTNDVTYQGTSAAINIVSSSDSLQINDNIIEGGFNNGIDLWESIAKDGAARIFNNTIAGEDGMLNGISTWRIKNFEFYFNSINLTNTTFTSSCFASVGDSSLVIQNNNFVNHGTGYAFEIDFVIPNATIDYNNFWSTKGIYYLSEEFVNIDDYKAATGYDMHSISVDPIYISSTDLHALNPALNGSGRGINGIAVDIDGDIRDNNPDIGADEIQIYPADVGVTSISFSTTPCQGSNDVYVSIQNLGTSLLGKTTIEWTVDGAEQNPFVWVGALNTGEVSSSFKIGSIDFNTVNNYTIKAKTTLPNDLNDPNLNNDLKIIIVKPAASGIYSIGGTSPDFTTIQKAVDMLATNGVCGSVIFNIHDGIYNEQVSIPEIKGVSEENRIVFQSISADAAAVSIAFAPDIIGLHNYVVLLDNANYISFKNITVDNKVYGGDALLLRGEIRGLQIRGSRLKTHEITTYNAGGICLDGFGAQLYDSRIIDNEVIGGSIGMFLNGSYSGLPTSDSIANNRIRNQFITGIQVMYLNESVLYANEITNDSPVGETYKAIAVSTLVNMSVINNKIVTQGTGIFVEESNNFIVANNFITIKDGLNYKSSGVLLSHSSMGNIFYNSVLVNDLNNYSSVLSIENLTANNGATEIRNNIFANSGGGLSIDVLGLYSKAYLVSENNNLFSTGPYIVKVNTEGETYYNSIATLNIKTNQEANSVIGDPKFISSTDLHAQAEILVGAAKPIVLIQTDIDGQMRSASYPTIGADEFGTLKNYNLAITGTTTEFICNSSEPLGFKVRNLGTQTIQNFTIQWLVNGQAQSNQYWVGSLLNGAETIYYFTGKEFTPNQLQHIHIKISEPNGQSDEVLENNEVDFNFTQYPAVNIGPDIETCSESSITLDAGDYKSFTWSNESYLRTIAPTLSGQYSVSVTDKNNCITSDEASVSFLFIDPIIEAKENVFCDGESLELTVVTSVQDVQYQYQWKKDDVNVAGTDSKLLIHENGTYVVSVSKGACKKSSNPFEAISQTKPPKPEITFSRPLEFNAGDSVLLEASSGFSYLWSDGSVSQNIVVYNSGKFFMSVSNSNGCWSESSEEIEVIVHPITTGLNEIQDEIDIYPNPCSRYVNIKGVTEKIKKQMVITVDNSMGQISSPRKTFWNGNDLVLDMDGYCDGIYFVKVQLGSNVEILKLFLAK